jgi:hypothetical protein
MNPRLRFVDTLLLLTVFIAFVDESVRRAVPSHPVMVTAGKQALFTLAGLLILLNRGVPFGPLVMFAPWTIYTLASSCVVAMDYDAPVAIPAVALAYSASPVFFAVGYYLGAQPEVLRRVGRIYAIGCIAAIAIAVIEEYARGALPEFITARIYTEKHAEAGGAFVESLFASPQILAEVMFPFVAWCVLEMLIGTVQRTRLLAAIAVIAAGFGIFLSRIRVAVLLAGLMVLFIALLARKTGLSLGRLTGRVVATLVALSLLLTILVAVLPEDTYGRKGEKDRDFFGKLLDPSSSFRRLGIWAQEISELPPDHNPTFGYGTGTGGGQMRTLIGDIRLLDRPMVYDTGIALLYYEMGIVGFIVFVLGFVVFPIYVLIQLFRAQQVAPAAVASIAVYFAFLGWFLFKAHPVISNVLSHSVWVAMLGVCYSLLNTPKPAHATEHDLQQSWQYEPARYPSALGEH